MTWFLLMDVCWIWSNISWVILLQMESLDRSKPNRELLYNPDLLLKHYGINEHKQRNYNSAIVQGWKATSLALKLCLIKYLIQLYTPKERFFYYDFKNLDKTTFCTIQNAHINFWLHPIPDPRTCHFQSKFSSKRKDNYNHVII